VAHGPELSLDRLCGLPIADAREFLAALTLDATQGVIAAELLKEIRSRLDFLDQVGLGYLALDRKAPTLSGGESQRIRLAAQIGSGLSGVLYVLDEPSIGLAPKMVDAVFDNVRLLREQGKAILMVEQNVKKALSVSDRGGVMELGSLHIQDQASRLIGDERVARLYLGKR
jgi:excinuclease ABC subunit A